MLSDTDSDSGSSGKSLVGERGRGNRNITVLPRGKCKKPRKLGKRMGKRMGKAALL